MLTDAHAHPFDLFTASGTEPALGLVASLCANAHEPNEFAWNERFAERSRDTGRVVLSFGVHPQNPDPDTVPFLESLARQGRIGAVGEAGYDLFTEAYRSDLERQRLAWAAQLRIAREWGLPLVVHCRKALDLVFADSRLLSALNSVIFHGWPGSPVEAKSFLKRGVNAWFSAGKGLLRGDRSLIATVESLPRERILAETDAPWMTLRGERYTVLSDIGAVHERIAALWRTDPEETEGIIGENFDRAYGIRR